MNCLNRITSALIKAKTIRRYASNLYEPDYLETMKSPVPLYDTLNIQLRGYDFPILENFQKLVHHIARTLDINVEDAWAIPHEGSQVTNFKPRSEIVHCQHNLKIYQRTVQITDLSASQLSTLLRALDASAPTGVTIDVVPHEERHDEVRYVPDSDLKSLKQQLDDMGGPRKK